MGKLSQLKESIEELIFHDAEVQWRDLQDAIDAAKMDFYIDTRIAVAEKLEEYDLTIEDYEDLGDNIDDLIGEAIYQEWEV